MSRKSARLFACNPYQTNHRNNLLNTTTKLYKGFKTVHLHAMRWNLAAIVQDRRVTGGIRSGWAARKSTPPEYRRVVSESPHAEC
eukprot:5615798-Pyramimonas_sp.AAC.1